MGEGSPNGPEGEPNGEGGGAGPNDRSRGLPEKFGRKSWGELTGEIKNQIISDLKARYGEEYAKYIKLYFEQLAEKK